MHVMIIGGGEVGSYLAGLLLGQSHQVTVIEAREEALAALRESAPGARQIHGDGTDPGVLEASGIHTVAMLAAVTGSDPTNLVITGLARFAFAVPRTLARVNNPHNSWMFIPAMGVDSAINQADVLARLIARSVEH